MATAARLDLEVDAKGVEKGDAALRGLESSAKKATSATKKLAGAEKGAATATKRLAKDTANLKRQVAGLVVAYVSLGAAVAAISIIGEFEEASQTVKAIGQAAKASEEDIAGLAKQTRALGASTRFTATQVAEAQVNLLRAGLSSNEVLQSTADVLNLATAANIDLARAAEISAITLKQFGLSATQSERVVDVLTATSNSAATTVEQLAEALKFSAPVAAAFGLSIEETSAALGVLSNAGLQASLAGTGLRGILARLAAPTGMAAGQISLLAKASGQLSSDFDITKNTLREVFEAFARAGAGPKDLLKIFGRLQAPAALTLTNAVSELGKFEDRLSDIAGETEKTAKTINDTLKGDILALTSALNELIFAINDGVGPSLRSLVQFATEVARALTLDSEKLMQTSTAAKIAAAAVALLTAAAAAFLAIKFAAAVGVATQSIFAMIVAIRGLKIALTSTGIGAIVVLLGSVAAFALEAAGAFDDAAVSADDLREKQRRAAEEDKARDAEETQRNLAKASEHERSIAAVEEEAIAQDKLDKQRKAAADRAVAASKRQRAEAKRAAEELLELQASLTQRRDVGAGGSSALATAKFVDNIEELLALKNKLKLKPGEGIFDAFTARSKRTGGDASAAEQEARDTIDRLKELREEGVEVQRTLGAQRAGFKGFISINDAIAETRRGIDGLLVAPEDQSLFAVTQDFADEIAAVEKAIQSALDAPAGSIFKITLDESKKDLEDLMGRLDELSKFRTLQGLIVSGNEAEMVMAALGDASDFTSSSLAEFENASAAAIAGLQAQKELVEEGTVAFAALEAEIASVGVELDKFAQSVARQDLLEDLESVAISTTNAFFDLFETLIDGSKTAAEAFAAFIKTVIRALFQKFVVEQTIQAIQAGFGAISAAGSAGGGLAALPSVASAEGNVFDHGQVKAFQRGGIIGGPTLFPLGLAGEAGPEAILPLARGPNGQLGVQTAGGERTGRRPGANPFIMRSLSPGASEATTAAEVRTGTSRTTNVQMNIETKDADSFRRSRRQMIGQALSSARFAS